MIVKNVFLNYIKDGLIWQEFKVGLDTCENLVLAKEVIHVYYSQQKHMLPQPLPNMMVEEIGDSSVVVKIILWVDIFKTNNTKGNTDTGELLKSKVLCEKKDVLPENSCNLPSLIVEHRMYKEALPLRVKMIKWAKYPVVKMCYSHLRRLK